jgi:hypothetical protein
MSLFWGNPSIIHKYLIRHIVLIYELI